VKCKPIFDISRAHGTCLNAVYIYRSPPMEERIALPKSLSWIWGGHFEAEERERKGKEGRDKKRRKMDENDVRKHIRNKFLVTALAVSSPRAVNSETAFAASCRTAPGNSVYFLSTRSSLASASPKPRIVIHSFMWWRNCRSELTCLQPEPASYHLRLTLCDIIWRCPDSPDIPAVKTPYADQVAI